VSEQPVSELHFAAPALGREDACPDLERVQNEDWFFIWEGGVSVDTPNVDIDGPPTRNGVLEVDGPTVTLRDGGRPFCAGGVEPFDILAITGCDPSRGDQQCGIDETCFVHPDSPTNVTSGLCIPTDDVDALSGVCRDFLITQRKYTIRETYADRIVIGERRRVLRTTPLDGCTDANQCAMMHDVERALASTDHPVDQELGDEAFDWECGADPSRAPGVPRCMMICSSSADCEDGHSCSAGFCVEGALPPLQCTEPVQRYQMRVGDAFAVVGERTGFLHNRTAATADDVAASAASEVGECIENPNGNPLLVGRVPLRPPSCTGDGMTDFTPNPCRVDGGMDHVEDVFSFSFNGEQCVSGAETRRTRQAPSVRVRNPSFTVHLVDTESEGNLECRGDRNGGLPAHGTVFPGYQMNFELTAGKFPFFIVGLNVALPSRVAPGPDGRLWVLDEGDSTVTTNGKVLILDPLAAPEGFGLITIL
jgi:hypothetical protein